MREGNRVKRPNPKSEAAARVAKTQTRPDKEHQEGAIEEKATRGLA